ncbi:MAG: hypothetical protein U0175_33695 [Caldilineaceae bacterium]
MFQDFENDAMLDQEQLNPQDEAMLLMSLALDDMLDTAEEARFHSLLDQDANLSLIWEDWQRIDTRFSSLGRVLPPVDFVKQFEARLEQQEVVQLGRANLFVVIGALVIWGGMIAGGLVLGYNAYANQARLMSDFVHSFTAAAASLMHWIHAFNLAFATATSSPQTVGFFVGYACAAGAALLWWIHFLRNNTQATGAQQV